MMLQSPDSTAYFHKYGHSISSMKAPHLFSSGVAGTNISIVKREMKPILRPSMKQEVANMDDALAQMQRSGNIYFLKSLRGAAIQERETGGKFAELTLPAKFVNANGGKFEEWVILRARLSRGKSSRPWLVKLRVDRRGSQVQIGRGWHSFVAGNLLEQGDSLIFLLKEDARSEFEVHVFRGPEGAPHFPEEGENRGENSPTGEEDEEEYVSDPESEEMYFPPSRGHQEVELNKFRNGKASPIPRAKHLEKHHTYPGFRKRLTATSIRGSYGDSNSGHFEFPWGFVKTHGNHLHGSVKLQGIHEDSPTYLVSCRRRPQHCFRVSILPSEWSRFVKENGLKNGHELQFSLVDESFFVVRKV